MLPAHNLTCRIRCKQDSFHRQPPMRTPDIRTVNQGSKTATTKHALFGDRSTTPFFQAKLTVNQPGDRFEREADRLADQVMRMHEADAPIAQRMPLTPVSSVQRTCAACEEKEKVQRKETGDAGGHTAPPIISEVLSSGGQPLNDSTRQFMESRMGQDFSQVRVHTDMRAAGSAAAIQARAYTSGRDIVFGSGEYQPENAKGKRLLAHELVHVGQQGKSGAALQRQPAPELINPFETPDEARAGRIERLLQMEPDPAVRAAIVRNCPVTMASIDRFRCVIREVALAPFRRQESSAFLRRIHGMGQQERRQLARDRLFTDELKTVLRGTAFWTVYSSLFFYGGRIPDPFRRVNVGIFSGDFSVVADALSLAVTESVGEEYFDGLKDALRIRFTGHPELPVLIRMINSRQADAPAVTGLRHSYQEVHYEMGADATRQLQTMTGNIHASAYVYRGDVRVVVPIRFLDGEDARCTAGRLSDCLSFYPIGDHSVVQHWGATIRSYWNNKFVVTNGRERYNLVFIPFFASERDDLAHPIRVMGNRAHSCYADGSNPGREHASCWFVNTTDRTVAHEFGHLIGASDEYRLPGSVSELTTYAPAMSAEDVALSNYESLNPDAGAQPLSTAGHSIPDSLMASNSDRIHDRHLTRLIRLINAGLPAAAPHYQLVRRAE